eukprot:TRINITY_DN30908_c0_g1_i1.p1 TRINITY_DN30908_c0_g1~~TRINITY_DN30908_c0_g1_i1.p1  ORF type:complete len:219 (+),score=42.03 TRINITY_DN30908_c0_g1_i1:64-720(+)
MCIRDRYQRRVHGENTSISKDMSWRLRSAIFPFKKFVVYGSIGYLAFSYYTTNERKIMMRKIRAKQDLLRETTLKTIATDMTLEIKDLKNRKIGPKDFEGSPVFAFFGDFKKFYRIYSELQKEKQYGDLKYIFISETDNQLISQLAQMHLQDTTLAVIASSENVPEANTIYFFSRDGETVQKAVIKDEEEEAILRLIKVRLNKDLDQIFVRSFDFSST